MLFTANIFISLLAPEVGGSPWYNIPGFEAWKIFNLVFFVGFLIYILRRPVGESLRMRREGIRQQLMRAQEERDAANAKLQEVEARLANLNQEVVAVREQAQREAAAEREHIARSTDEDAQKLRTQAQREIESAGKVARQQLRRFAAEQSVRLAEEMVRREMRPEDDARLLNGYVEDLGGLRR